MANPENLSAAEIAEKIKHLERGIRMSIIRCGTENFCRNRIRRVKLLKSYL